MAKPTTSLSKPQQDFITRQRLFFVATAAPDGRVNLSPKGLDTLKIMAPDRIVWLSLSGSGNETAAHLLENDRMTLMFCAFEGKPGIIRAYGHARAIHPHDGEWDSLVGLFPSLPGTRQIFDVAIDLVQTSCGTGIPEFVFQKERAIEQLLPFYDEMDQAGLKAYWTKKNTVSLDGKPTGIFES
ncbi:MAG: pyridoxamine 5'-phosphate oxidase family protein [Pseudomonadota bacterium]